MLDHAAALADGAENMLIRCGGLRLGDRVLVIHEPAGHGYYDEAIADAVVRAARGLGIHATLREEPFSPSPVTPGRELAAAMHDTDLTVFLARLGDQLRFNELPEDTRAIVSYAINAPALASAFGRLDHRGMSALRDAIDAALISSKEVAITCPKGTEVRGRVAGDGPEPKDTNTIRFPRLVHTPMPAAQFSGQVALRGFLVGTGSQYYEPYACRIDGTLLVQIEGNRITGFDGDPKDVARAAAHYAHVARSLGIDERFVHSWHAGIQPGCAFPEPASASFERWTGSAFGNPRLLHFHTCGAYAPGEISINIVDPTVTADGVAVWEGGRLYPERVESGAEILAAYPEIKSAFDDPVRECGLAPDGRLSFR